MTEGIITIEEQEEALTPILEGITGIVEHFTDFPDAVQARQLPCLITSPKEASYDRDTYGADSLLIRRQWQAVLLVKLAVEGREFQAEQEIKPFLTAVPVGLAAYPVITLEDGRGFQVELDKGSDRGARAVKYNDKWYTGTVFTFFTIVEDMVDPVDTL
jgi:hypothetical protein